MRSFKVKQEKTKKKTILVFVPKFTVEVLITVLITVRITVTGK